MMLIMAGRGGNSKRRSLFQSSAGPSNEPSREDERWDSDSDSEEEEVPDGDNDSDFDIDRQEIVSDSEDEDSDSGDASARHSVDDRDASDGVAERGGADRDIGTIEEDSDRDRDSGAAEGDSGAGEGVDNLDDLVDGGGGNAPETPEWVLVTEEDDVLGPVPDFLVRNPGPQNAPQDANPIDYFSLFFSDVLFVRLVRETNSYARAYLRHPAMVAWVQQHRHSRFRHWPANGITVADLKKYLGLCLNMGLIRKKRLSDYWNTRRSQRTPFFGEVMSLRTFLLINRMFHANTVDAVPRGEAGFDPWHKIRPVLDHLNTAFKRHFIPYREISIDESLVGMKNRCAFIQYLRNKRHARFGIKKFQLCDSHSGYVCHVSLYAGKELDQREDEEDVGQGHAVVMELMRSGGYLDKGYHLYTDNFYTKPALADALVEKLTPLTGTVASNSVGLPDSMKTDKRRKLKLRLKVGEMRYMRQGLKLLVGFREKASQDKPVLVMSTAHKAMSEKRLIRHKERNKPTMIYDYNTYMGGVDLSDKKVYHIAAERATHRYWVKLFRNLLDISVLNAYEIYKLSVNDQQRKRKYDFVVDVIESLCGPVDEPNPQAPIQPLHRLFLLDGRKERDCVVCSDRSVPGGRKRSRHWCPACDVGCHERCEPRLQHGSPHAAKRGRGGRGRGRGAPGGDDSE